LGGKERKRRITTVLMGPLEHLATKIYFAFTLLALALQLAQLPPAIPFAWFGALLNLLLFILGYLLLLLPEFFQHLDNL
jgi:hypothetical protein